MCDVHSVSELPLHRINCGCPLCVDCVIRGHAGHKVKINSDVVEIQVQQNKSLSNDYSVLFLKVMLADSKSRLKLLTEQNPNLPQNGLADNCLH